MVSKDISLSTRLKQMRTEKNVTQEELADYLNVTYQAVSRWERGEGYPDIMHLPKLARFFGVSIDQLFGISEEEDQDKIRNYVKQSTAYRNAGNVEADLKLWQNAYHEFPSDCLVITNLVEAMYFADYKAYSTEIAEYGNKVLKNCKDYSLHYRVIRRMCLMYIKTNQKDIAYDYIQQLPDYTMTKGQLSLYILNGDALVEQIQRNLCDLLVQIMINIEMIPDEFFKGNPELKLEILKKQHEICSTFFEYGDFGFFNKFICSIYSKEVAEYMKRQDKEKVLDTLEKYFHFAIECDVPTCYRHRSILFTRLSYDSSKVIRFSRRNECRVMLDLLKSELFDSLRSEPRFVTIFQRISEYAN